MKKSAIDFLTKPVESDDLLKAIRLSLERDAEKNTERVASNSLREYINKLTPREYEIMTYVNTSMLNNQVAYELDISEETVKIHRSSVMQKLEIVSVAELVRLCGKAGIAPAKPSK
jgi:FixJ family two-component response regulator